MSKHIDHRKFWFLMVFLVTLLLVQIEAFAFHDSSSLVCNKCHTMHYSQAGAIPSKANGAPVDADANGPFPHMIYMESVSDLCLTCHAENGVTGGWPVYSSSGALTIKVPGGNFYYSKSDNATYGKKYGHNPGGTVIGTDSTLTTAPGGTFLTSEETCISCHDEHGDSDMANGYRNLLFKPGNWTGANRVIFAAGGQSGLNTNESGTNYPVYTSGMSTWCGACHSNPDNGGAGFHGRQKTDLDVGDGIDDWIRHPTDYALGTGMASNYGAPSYDWQYPAEFLNFNNTPGDEGWEITKDSEVFCLSCHRAHGTQYPDATRWDNRLASGVGTGCNKCHAKGQ